MSTYYTLLTAAGQARLTNALATGTTVQLTQIAVGDGNGNPVTPTESRTALVREVYRGGITRLQVDVSNPNWLIAELAIPMATGGWTIREIGLYDVNGTLIAYGNFPDSYKPILSEGSGKEVLVRMYVETSATAAVQLLIDPTVVLASRSWVLSQLTPAVLLPGGTTGQILKKTSNANGAVAWSDPAAADINVNARREEQTAAAAQTIFTLSTLTTVGLAVYVEGVRVFNFATLDNVRIQFTAGLPAGTKVNFIQNDPAMPYLNSAFRPKTFFMNGE